MENAQTSISADDLRLLDRDEAQLVKIAQSDDLQNLGQDDLDDTLQRLRDRRDRARDLANRQRREARGKVDPSGATPATRNDGNEAKARILGNALDQMTEERDRRASDAAPDQRALAERALATKEKGKTQNPMMEDGGPLHPKDPDADPGKGPMQNQERRTAPSGALDHAGELPSRERSRTRY